MTNDQLGPSLAMDPDPVAAIALSRRQIMVQSMTDRQQQYMDGAVAGMTSRQIGARMGVTASAVNQVLERARAKAKKTRLQIAAEIARMQPRLPATVTLKPKQLAVLRHAESGLCIKRTARAMFVVPSTIREHRCNAMRVLGAKSTLEAVVIAIRQGLL